jgi:hypothetical protein
VINGRGLRKDFDVILIIYMSKAGRNGYLPNLNHKVKDEDYENVSLNNFRATNDTNKETEISKNRLLGR